LLVDKKSRRVLCVHVAEGKVHDLKVFRGSGLNIDSDTLILADKGYLGIGKDHPASRTPHRKPRNGKLSAEQKQHNRVLARLRMGVEHVIRRLKVFRILAERYRNRRRRFGLRLNLIAAICNQDR
jgi:IS5 family transposase